MKKKKKKKTTNNKSFLFFNALLYMHCILKKELPWFLETSAYIIDPFIEERVHILNLDHFLQMETLCGDQNEQHEFYFC